MRKRSVILALSTVLIMVLLISGVLLIYSHHHQIPVQTTPPGTKGVITHSLDTPSEATITNYTSTATGDEPKSITLPTISEKGYIEKIGIDQNNQVASPDNVNLAGWYVNSVKPGQAGLSIIDGHVDGKTGPGIFLRLDKLSSGDEFQVELANDTTLTYRVRSVTSVKVADVPSVLFAQNSTIKSQLNLITCYGNFNYTSDQYDQRTIVVSELVTNS